MVVVVSMCRHSAVTWKTNRKALLPLVWILLTEVAEISEYKSQFCFLIYRKYNAIIS